LAKIFKKIMIFVEKKIQTKFWGFRQKLSIKSGEFTPPSKFENFQSQPLPGVR
jgi:hypothetical protein